MGSARESAPLLPQTASNTKSDEKESKSSLFSRFRETDGNATRGSKQAQRQMLCMQFSLFFMLAIDFLALVGVAWFSMALHGASTSTENTFFSFNWLLDPSTPQWEFWGLPVIISSVKVLLFVLCARTVASSTLLYSFCHIVSITFIALLAYNAVRLDSLSQTQEEHFLLRGANVANSLPLIFTVLEVVNLRYLRGSDETQDENPRKGMSLVQMLHILKPYFWPQGFNNKIRAGSTYIILVASKAANLSAPLFMAATTNALVSKDLSRAILYVGLYCGVTLTSRLLKELQSLIYLRVKQTAYIELATLTYEHVHTLSYDWHVHKKLGDVLRSMDRGVESANSVVSFVFLNLMPTLVEAIVVVIIFAAHFQLATISIIAFVSLVLYAYLTIRITLWRKQFREASVKHDNEYHDKATDALLNYETIKYFANEKYEVDEYARVIQKYQKNSVSVQASLNALNGTQSIIMQFTVFATLGLAIPHVVSDSGRHIDVGSFVAISVYLANLFQPLSFLGTIYNMVINSVVDMRKLSELLSVEPDIVDVPNAQELTVCNYDLQNGIDVVFKDVSFHYPSQDAGRGIQNVSFTIERGTTTAIVGETGAGKTTLSRLVFRFYELTGGKILVNHHNIREVTQQSLRRAVGIVPQDTVMFNTSILHNIQYGNLNASFAQVEQAAKSARIYDFIMSLPEQWDTKVGERGLKLSGGEKQRVAIARTLLKDPPVVVLDEATSALDTVTEQEIQSALNKLTKNRTMLVIAHRLSTIQNAHQIIVMQEGSVAEMGTHAELLAKQGLYDRMWSTQQKSEVGSAMDLTGASQDD